MPADKVDFPVCFQGEIPSQFQLLTDSKVRSIAKNTNLWIKSNFKFGRTLDRVSRLSIKISIEVTLMDPGASGQYLVCFDRCLHFIIHPHLESPAGFGVRSSGL